MRCGQSDADAASVVVVDVDAVNVRKRRRKRVKNLHSVASITVCFCGRIVAYVRQASFQN